MPRPIDFVRNFPQQALHEAHQIQIKDADVEGRPDASGYLIDARGTQIAEDGLAMVMLPDGREALSVSAPEVARFVTLDSILYKEAEQRVFVPYPPAPFDPMRSLVYPFIMMKRLSFNRARPIPALTITVPMVDGEFQREETSVERTAFLKKRKVRFDKLDDLAEEDGDLAYLREMAIEEAEKQDWGLALSPRLLVQTLKRIAEQGCADLVQRAGYPALYLNTEETTIGGVGVWEHVWNVQPKDDVRAPELPVVKALRTHGALVNQHVLEAVLDQAPPPFSEEALIEISDHTNRKQWAWDLGAAELLEWDDTLIGERVDELLPLYREGYREGMGMDLGTMTDGQIRWAMEAAEYTENVDERLAEEYRIRFEMSR